jgi:hypothetical protein
MHAFVPFDPLEAKVSRANDAAFDAIRREITNILSSYVGWYDPFCELIQNALDAVDARRVLEKAAGSLESYHPEVRIFIDLDDNSLTVTDNGIGLDKEKFEQFLAPNFSFNKSDKTRGHKGVGATYVAYGFNYMRVSTKTPGYIASGRILNARNWVKSSKIGDNPKVEPDGSARINADFDDFDRGVSIIVKFDETTHPKKLSWVRATNAKQWKDILSIKTGIGSVSADSQISIVVQVKNSSEVTRIEWGGTGYLWLHERAAKKASFKELIATQEKIFKQYGPNRPMPDRYKNLDFIFGKWTAEELEGLISNSLDAEEKEVLKDYNPSIAFEFGYTAKIWQIFNEKLGIRSGHRVLTSGFQLAANNMPQGETYLVPLNRNTGRQNQIHFLIHFENYTPDLGRKGFNRELVDFAKTATRSIMENHLSKLRPCLKSASGGAPDLAREMKIDDWKTTMIAHESDSPLLLKSKNFFKPTERVSITSRPTREQDVIALFHQLIAGGVIRGISVMSTNERFIYDGLFRISFDLDQSLYVYDAEDNPLGVTPEIVEALGKRKTSPKILEYKYYLDGLFEDFDEHDKNIKDIDLCVVWSTGDVFREKYAITSFLTPENSDQRPYHGVTHALVDIENGSRYCDLIVLSELVDYLNDPVATAEGQREKYE